MRYLATEGPRTTGEIFWDAVDAAADVAAAPIAPYVKAGAALQDRDANIKAQREAAPRLAAEKKAEVKKTKLEQAREDYEAGNLTDEEYSNILDEIDPLPPPTAADAPAPRPASARAALPKKPEEPKPWFTEDNAPDTVFDGTDPLSGLVPASTQIKGNVYPSHLEWDAPVPYTADNPDAKKAADIDAEIAKLQEQISALENNPVVKSYQAGIDILIANRDKIAADVADGIISPVEGNLNINQINTRIAKLEELKEKELAKPPSQELIDLNKKKIALIDQRRKITITGNNASDFVAGLATQLDIPEAEVRAKLLTNDGIQSKDKDGYVKYNLVQNPETGELELVKSKAKYRTAPQMQRDALDATVSAGRFKIPFEREANIEIQENVQKRQADLEKKIVEIQLAGAKLNKRQVDPQRWMRNASLGNKVGAMMYMTLQGIWGGPEYAKKAADDITDLINQDIELQLKSITKDKEYVDFLKEDIGRIDKMFEGREKQIAAKHIIALEKAIQAAKMMPGADPAMVDYLEAELRTKQANEMKTIDEADKKEAYFGWAAPAAPKYGGGGGGGGKEKGSGQTINGVHYSNDYLENQGWFKDQYGGRPSPNALYAQANQLDSQIVPRLEAYIKAGGSINELIVTPEIKALIISAATLIQQGASDKDQETSNMILGYAGYKRIRDPRKLVAQIKEVAAMRRSYALSLTQLDPTYGEAPEKKQETKDK
jgi:soluble cytochrome b562